MSAITKTRDVECTCYFETKNAFGGFGQVLILRNAMREIPVQTFSIGNAVSDLLQQTFKGEL
jgi:hypothetical protein